MMDHNLGHGGGGGSLLVLRPAGETKQMFFQVLLGMLTDKSRKWAGPMDCLLNCSLTYINGIHSTGSVEDWEESILSYKSQAKQNPGGDFVNEMTENQ